MKRCLLLAGFALHVTIGGICFAPVAALANEGAGARTVAVTAMTPKAGVVCVSVQLMSVAGDGGSVQGGCADGHCLKMRSPEPQVTASSAPLIHQPSALPVMTIDLAELPAVCNPPEPDIDPPPFPPGTDTVVLRE